MRRISALALVLSLALGCGGRDVPFRGLARLPHAAEARPPRAPLEPLSVPWPDPVAHEPSHEAEDALLLGLRSAVIQEGAKSVGSTSLVLKVPLDGGLEAAFKPETKKHGSLWRSEVAAYRLARALGLDNIPPSVPRAAKLASLVASAGAGATLRKIEEQAIVQGEVVPGAMIAWLRGLRRLALEQPPLWNAWGTLLTIDGPNEPALLAEKDQAIAQLVPLASQISTMVAFDHVSGNVDRWSGHNVLVDVTGTRVVFLDNNLAFLPNKLAPMHDEKRHEVLHRVERFSRRFLDAVRKLDRPSLVATMGLDHAGAPLLTDAQLDACLVRRDELLKYVDSLVQKHGESNVFAYD